MADTNGFHAEAIDKAKQARTIFDFHRDAIDASTDYFAIIMSFVQDERVDYTIRLEYFKLAEKALKKWVARND